MLPGKGEIYRKVLATNADILVYYSVNDATFDHNIADYRDNCNV